ncbi:MAG: hypothetical protein R3257_07035, partial [bacterium]|nr:hypothetical protein [bacterium]
MGYSLFSRFFIFLTLILSMAAFGNMLSCSSEPEEAVLGGGGEVEEPPAEIVPDCSVTPLTGEGSEACTQTFISGSTITLGVYTQITGMGTNDGLNLKIVVDTNTDDFASGEWTAPVTDPGTRTHWVFTRNSAVGGLEDNCPAGLEGAYQGDPEDLMDFAQFFHEDFHDALAAAITSITGCPVGPAQIEHLSRELLACRESEVNPDQY